MITEIGVCAGEILNLLDERKEPLLVENIYHQVDSQKDIVLMSLGWLIREQFIHATQRKKGYEIKLNGKMTQDPLPALGGLK